MTTLETYLAELPAAELASVRDAQPVEAWLVRTGAPPLAFLWPSDEENTEDILFGPLIGIRCSVLLICLPSGWQRIVSRVSPWRLCELEAAEDLARRFRDDLLRPDGE